MKKELFCAMGALALLSVGIPARAADTVFPKNLVSFNSMVGNSAPYIKSDGVTIRGILGGPFPWDLTQATGTLMSNGALHIQVQGLIIPASAGFGYNPAPFFQAVVSCRTLTADADGNYYRNIVTPPADTTMIGDPKHGDAVINANVALPDTCIAPIVFVTSPAGKNPPTGFWFAATGDEPTAGSN